MNPNEVAQPGAFTDWNIAIGSQLPRGLLVVVCIAGALAIFFSAVSLFCERRRGRAVVLLALRTLAVAACLVVALQPMLELGQVTRVPNHVAVLVDSSRSMIVKPPEGQPRY